MLPSSQGHRREPQGPFQESQQGGQRLFTYAPAPCVSERRPALCPPALPPAGPADAATLLETPAASPSPAAAPQPAAGLPAGCGSGCPSPCRTRREGAEREAGGCSHWGKWPCYYPRWGHVLCPRRHLPPGSLPCPCPWPTHFIHISLELTLPSGGSWLSLSPNLPNWKPNGPDGDTGIISKYGTRLKRPG